jgi:membrane-anchored mycosin MYCP
MSVRRARAEVHAEAHVEAHTEAHAHAHAPTVVRGAALFAVAVVTVVATQFISVSAAASAVGGGTRLADNSNCTIGKLGSSITTAPDQTAVPWEIANAGVSQLSSGSNAVTGAGVKVAIIDTGANATNAQLADAITGGQDFTGGNNDRTDVDGHGTMVASIIGARANANNGMVGIAPGADLLIYREAGCNVTSPPANDEDTLANAIRAAVGAGARIINISQDGCTPDAKLQSAVQYAYESGVLIVTSAGNFGDSQDQDPNTNTNCGVNPVMYPAAYVPYVLSVGAADQDGNVPTWSETGSYVGVCAPGLAIGALFPNGQIVIDSGTSFAAPYVAGLAALIVQAHPDWTPAILMKVLESTASGHGSWNDSAGWGDVNVMNALKADPSHLIGLYGSGPNADGPASAAPKLPGAAMAPIVAAAPSPSVVDQRKGAYIAVAGALLFVVVAVAGTLIARDARRRRQLFL